MKLNQRVVPAAVATFALAAAGCGRSTTPAADTAADTAAAARPAASGGWTVGAGKQATTAAHGLVVSNSALASQAGLEILRAGGNAVDAAVATGFALAVTFPPAGNIGGGGFMVIRMADGRSAAIDYREVAPLAATRDMYVGKTGKLTSRVGGLAAGVPGSVAGMAMALHNYGTMSLAQVMAPAIRLASEGFVVDSTLSQAVAAAAKLIKPFDGAALFFPGGNAIAPGSKLVQTDLANTLRKIAKHGPAGFYAGTVADSFAAEQRRDQGIITTADLARYKAISRKPVIGTYRGDTVLSMPPSSSGGITAIESLNILEKWSRLPPFGSAAYDHDVAEAFRRAFIDRNTLLGDPAFVKVPMAHLVSKSYADTLRRTIRDDSATPSPTFNADRKETMQTTHYSVVDDKGDAVSTTTTLNGYFGGGAYVRGAGFFINNEMDDFATEPGKPNMFGLVQGEVNSIVAGKRMLSSMTPTIVLDSAGKVLLVVGAAGGPTITTTTVQIIMNVVDNGMDLAHAMSAPRLHEQTWPDELVYETGGIPQAVADSLGKMGYKLHPVGHLANSNDILRVAGGWSGMVEPRSSGGVAGY